MAQSYRTKPSDLYGIHDELAAWCFNRAVQRFGMHVQGKLDEATNDAKSDAQAQSARMRVMHRWLGVEQKFKSPTSTAAL